MAKWSGWWEQQGLGRQKMYNLVLDIDSEGRIVGGGDDCIGRFTFRGQFRPDGTVSLVKQYVGLHQVAYEGCNSGEGIFGTWCISVAWPFCDTGKFALRPVADHLAETAEIEEVVPAY
jgi:hypothetical protein